MDYYKQILTDDVTSKIEGLLASNDIEIDIDSIYTEGEELNVELITDAVKQFINEVEVIGYAKAEYILLGCIVDALKVAKLYNYNECEFLKGNGPECNELLATIYKQHQLTEKYDNKILPTIEAIIQAYNKACDTANDLDILL